MSIELLMLCKSEQLRGQLNSSFDSLARCRNARARLIRLFSTAFGEPQAGVDHSQEVSEIMRDSPGHFTNRRKSIRRPLAFCYCDSFIETVD